MKTYLSILLSLFCCLFVQSCESEQQNQGDAQKYVTDAPLHEHPIYKTYSFSQAKNVIEIGVQPLWVPTSIIFEFIKRDPILKQAMTALSVQLVFHPFLKGNDVNYFLAKGDLELGIGGDMPTLRGVSNYDWLAFSLVQEGNVAIVSKNVREIPNLKGKKIGYALGSNAHFYLLNTLKKYDIHLSDVILVQMDVTQMHAAIIAGRIDAFAAWEPTPTLAISKTPDLIITHRGKSYGFLYGRKQILTEHPEVIKHLLASEIRALKWLRKERENLDLASGWSIKAVSLLNSTYTFLTKAELNKLALQDLPGIRVREYPRITQKMLSGTGKLKMEFDLLRQIGFIPKKVKWEDARAKFNLETMESVISMAQQYKIFEPVDVSSQ